MEQPSLCAAMTEPVLQSLGAPTTEPCNYWNPQAMPCNKEATARGSLHATTREYPCWPQLEKSLRSNEDPAQPKINKI